MMKNEIGIMQGRLSVAEHGRFQFFPLEWREEFVRARGMGFDHIEWLADWFDKEQNPLISGNDLEEIRLTIKKTGVRVRSLCADYFMIHGFYGDEGDASRAMLVSIIERAATIGCEVIVVPFLEKYAIVTESQKSEIIHHLTYVLKETAHLNVLLAFETELPAQELFDFVNRFGNPRVGVCYDIGNCTSYGFDCPRDIEVLKEYLFDVHIKDRRVGETRSLLLGTGAADLERCFSALAAIGYKGPLVLQAWKGENYLEDARVQAQYVKQILQNAHESSLRENAIVCPGKFSVKGKIVLLTGGAGFLGVQYGEALAEAGASVVIFDKQNEETLQKTTKRFLCGEGVLHSGFSVDITDERAVRVAVDKVISRYGRIDCLINNAAMNPAVGSPESVAQFNPYDAYDIGLWRKEVEINLTGTQIVTQAVAPVMMRQRSGSVVNIASELSLIAYDHRIYGEESGKHKSPAYITTKAGILGLTRAWAEYLGHYDVRVNAFSPGGMQTEKHPKEFVDAYARHNMLGRMAQVGEYNGVVIFLCSDASSFMTGHNLVADGGKSAW